VVTRPPEIDAGTAVESHESEKKGVARSGVGGRVPADPGCAITVDVYVQYR